MNTFALRKSAAFLLVISFLLPCLSLAQTTKTDIAKENFLEGVAQFSNQNYRKALTSFKKSYEQKPKVGVLYNIAMCQKALSLWTESIATFELFKLKAGESTKPRQAQKTKEALQELYPLVGRIIVSNAPDGSKIQVDNKIETSAPMKKPVLLNPGLHLIEISAEGFETQSISIEITSGEKQDIKAVLKPEKKEDTVSESITYGPSFPRGDIEPSEGDTSPLFITGLVSGGLGIIAAGLGGYFTFRREVTDMDAANEAVKDENEKAYDRAIEQADRDEAAIIASFATAGVFLAASAIILIADKKKDPSDEVVLKPSLNGIGVTF